MASTKPVILLNGLMSQSRRGIISLKFSNPKKLGIPSPLTSLVSSLSINMAADKGSKASKKSDKKTEKQVDKKADKKAVKEVPTKAIPAKSAAKKNGVPTSSKEILAKVSVYRTLISILIGVH
jgi:hypothetical protein